MRVRTWSACVVLAWGILLIVTAVGSSGPFRFHPAQANTRIASSTSNTSTKITITTQATLTASVTSAPAARPHTAKAAASMAAPAPSSTVRTDARTYVVQPGDTLSGIAAALGVRGGWPALFAANQPAVGPDPGLIIPGTVLTLPGPAAPAHYTVAAGGTLSVIAAALAIPGGWPALYAANRRVIGTDPNAIQAGNGARDPPPGASPAVVARTSPAIVGVARPTPGADAGKDAGIGAAIGNRHRLGIGRASTATGADGRHRASPADPGGPVGRGRAAPVAGDRTGGGRAARRRPPS